MTSARRYLPHSHFEGLVDPDARVGKAPGVWVHRPMIGVFQGATADADVTRAP